MPVTKTAKRALRISKKKTAFNSLILSRLEKAVRGAKKTKSQEKILMAVSLLDKAASKKAVHKNKAARIKSSLAKLLQKSTSSTKKTARKTSRKK